MRATWMILTVAGLGLVAGACASAPRKGDAELSVGGEGAVVRVGDAMTASRFSDVMAEAARRSGARDECALFIGKVASGQGIAVHIEGRGLAADGIVLCGPQIEAGLRDPRIHQVVHIVEAEGVLYGTHPSGPGRLPLAELGSEERNAGPQLVGVLHERIILADLPVLPLLRRLLAIREHFVLLVWALPPPEAETG